MNKSEKSRIQKQTWREMEPVTEREKHLRNRGEVPSWQKRRRSEIMLKKFNEQEKFGKQIYIPM